MSLPEMIARCSLLTAGSLTCGSVLAGQQGKQQPARGNTPAMQGHGSPTGPLMQNSPQTDSQVNHPSRRSNDIDRERFPLADCLFSSSAVGDLYISSLLTQACSLTY